MTNLLFPEYILSEEIEHKYRMSKLALDCRQHSFWIITLASLMAVLAVVDIYQLGVSGIGHLTLVLIWLLFFVITVLVVIALPRIRQPAQVDWLVLCWWVLLISMLVQLDTRVLTSGAAVAGAVGVVLLIIYLMMPNRLFMQLASGLMLSLVSLYSLIHQQRTGTVQATWIVTATLLLVNALCFALAWRNHRLRRCLYCSQRRENKLITKVEQLNRIDYFTGLMNRRTFIELCASELDRYRRYQRPFSLLLLNLVQFRSINEHYGHDAGDELLTAFSRVISERTREQDHLGRIAGQEFAICLPETSLANAAELAQRIKTDAEGNEVLWNDDRIPIRVRIGVTMACEGDESVSMLLERADKALTGRSSIDAERTRCL